MKLDINPEGGNTKAVADLLAKEFNVNAKSVEIPINEYTDVLFLGGGVYGRKMDESLSDYIKNLDSSKVGQIICFSTTGFINSTILQIKQKSAKKGIKVNKNTLLLKMLLKGHSWLGLNGGKLSDKQKNAVKRFTDTVRKDIL